MLGLLIGSTETDHVTPLAYEDLVSGVARAATLPWDRIAELVSDSQDDGPKELEGNIGLYATASVHWPVSRSATARWSHSTHRARGAIRKSTTRSDSSPTRLQSRPPFRIWTSSAAP